ncbi:GNAT family N-acetyltransferase [Dehalobacter sp. DCM]|uniref:GNAT family N-acetyltransferase n=1 Tax=Dehalobacter sp. DCM TaxID=2907827 RepID=UPI0030816749|nr:GNAT family N-acetyltransferase [Dehalobacter sp. DCM]
MSRLHHHSFRTTAVDGKMLREERANQFKEEFVRNNEPVINGSALFDQMEYQEWLDYNRNNRNPATVSPEWVPATTFFAVRKADDRIVGMVDIRHHLDHPFLAAYGGHIGYAVRPSERKKGYATHMLKMALEYAHALGITKIMLGCYADNTASVRTITKCGGIFTESKLYPDGKPINMYWIMRD